MTFRRARIVAAQSWLRPHNYENDLDPMSNEKITDPPATRILACSSSLSGLWSIVNLWGTRSSELSLRSGTIKIHTMKKILNKPASCHKIGNKHRKKVTKHLCIVLHDSPSFFERISKKQSQWSWTWCWTLEFLWRYRRRQKLRLKSRCVRDNDRILGNHWSLRVWAHEARATRHFTIGILQKNRGVTHMIASTR